MNKEVFYSRVVPLLEAAASELSPQVNGVRVVLNSPHPEGYTISAFFDAPRSNADLLQLNISFNINDDGELIYAQVIWGHDSLYVEADYPEQGYAEATSENMERLLAEMPRLIGAFKTAVFRGYPEDDPPD